MTTLQHPANQHQRTYCQTVKASHHEEKYKNDEAYIIACPHHLYRYPQVDFHFNAPMDLPTAEVALEVVHEGELRVGALPSLMSRIYKVSIEEI